MVLNYRKMSPLVTVKHYHHVSNTEILTGTISSIKIINVVPNTSLPVNANDIKEGSVIKAVYVEMWVLGEGASDANTQFNLALYKNPNGGSTMTYIEIINLQGYDNKNNILFTSQGVIGGVGGGQAVAVARGWFKIPKGKQRFGRGDELVLAVATTGQDMQHCGLFVYKEYQ